MLAIAAAALTIIAATFCASWTAFAEARTMLAIAAAILAVTAAALAASWTAFATVVAASFAAVLYLFK